MLKNICILAEAMSNKENIESQKINCVIVRKCPIY